MTIQVQTTNHINVQDFDALTVDCFDTIYHKQFAEPVDVFDHVKGENSVIRAAKESDQRIRNRYTNGSFEVHITEFCPKYDDEKRVELAYGFKSQCVVDLMKRFRAAGKPIFVVSNTYWSSNDLRAFLKGIEYTSIYASCDHGMTKQNGLLKKVLEENDLIGKCVLHVGDDLEADFRTASELGLAAMRYRGYRPEVESLLQDLRKTGIEQFHKAPILDVKSALIDKVFSNDAQLYGYALVGPVISHFLHKITQQADGRLVTFIGRDSKLLHDLYQGKKQYLELNRLQAWQASLYDDQDIRDVHAYTNSTIPTDMLNHVNHEFHEYDLMKYRENFASFFKDRQQQILERSAVKRERLLEYLNTLNLSNPFFVDIGYAGTINKRLARILDKSFNVKNSQSMFLLGNPATSTKGILQYDNPYIVKKIMEGIALFESIIKDQVGPLIGYKDGKAVYGKYEWDEIQKVLTNHVRYGLTVYLEEVGFKEHKSTELYLAHFCLHPPLCLAMVRNELGLGSQVHTKMTVQL